MRQHDRRSPVHGATLAMFFIVSSSFAWAQTADADLTKHGTETDSPPASNRFSMVPIDGGFLRMDTDTGTVSLCTKKAGAWACETVPDDYKAVQEENAALKRELGELRGDRKTAKADRKLELPTEEEVDKAIGQFDKYLKKFKGLIEKYQSPDGPGRT